MWDDEHCWPGIGGQGDGRAKLGGELGDGEDDQFLPVLSRG